MCVGVRTNSGKLQARITVRKPSSLPAGGSGALEESFGHQKVSHFPLILSKKTMALTNDFQMSSLLGDHLLTKVGGPKKPTGELLKDKELVLLYFSASWCPPCKAFSPVLMDFYKAISEKGKMEIVYISSDKSLQEFEEYFKKMPWLSIPLEQGSAAIKSNLAECQLACAENEQCTTGTFILSGVDRGECWLAKRHGARQLCTQPCQSFEKP